MRRQHDGPRAALSAVQRPRRRHSRRCAAAVWDALTVTGISSAPGHYAARAVCLNRLAALFGGTWPVPSARFHIVAAASRS